jgi:hypothetical protein
MAAPKQVAMAKLDAADDSMDENDGLSLGMSAKERVSRRRSMML